ncbi:N(4)-acetylcytidine aminohydrolase [Vibrio porteresiae]|uniref:N(4)-acetylcytidine amidohydrolase n=1 Tax=Vibrio porteresiae DSM 19223 TaxID=1123496 RepID=A0ABZ0QB43_9VIBR|nr:N(4)-acetylcytidine aminohydrolase [Vibrio porteresiae]WPC72997.1 N(4)-acetylcytidine aminohydrolase [Vibrio porteresiae DSM 19223]
MTKHITFFERFTTDILAGKKVITIRDESEKDYQTGDIVTVATFEENRYFCTIEIESVNPVKFAELTEFHAQQENMTLPELKAVIHDIYPGIEALYVLTFHLVNEG